MTDEFDTTPAPWRNPRKPAEQMEALKRQATTAPSVRERLFREAKRQLPNEIDAAIECALDAILADLAEPSEGTCYAASHIVSDNHEARDILRAMIQHIQDGGA